MTYRVLNQPNDIVGKTSIYEGNQIVASNIEWDLAERIVDLLNADDATGSDAIVGLMSDSKIWSVEVALPAQPYYDRMTLEAAISDVKTMVEEWKYEGDEHNYCHVRPMLVKLVEAATGRGVEWR